MTTSSGGDSAALELSRQLRLGTGGYLTQRRAIVALSLVAIGAMSLISLYQMGVIKHVPEPRVPKLDSDRVDASAEAYQRLSIPDAVLGVGSSAATMGLAEMGGKDRAREQPWIPLVMASKVMFDLAQSLRMVRIQWAKYRAFCFWCLLSAAATLTTAVLALGETREAGREMLGRAKLNTTKGSVGSHPALWREVN